MFPAGIDCLVPPNRRRLDFSLAGLLAVLWLIDLGVGRWLARVLRQDLLAPRGPWRSAVDLAARFTYFFAAALAVLLAAVGLVRLLFFRRLVPRPARALISMLAIAFVPLALVGLCVRLPTSLHIYLQASFSALALLIGLAGLLAAEPLRARLGLLLFALPIAFRFAATLSMLTPGHGDLAMIWLRLGQGAAALAPVVGIACLVPVGVRWRWPLVLGAVVAGGASLLTVFDWELAARLAAYGFAIELPLTAGGTSAYALAMGAWAALIVALLLVGGKARLRGFGVALLGLAGFLLEQPGQMGAALTGLICLLFSFADAPAGADEDWRPLLREIGQTLGASEVICTNGLLDEEARLHFRRNDQPFTLVLTRRRGLLRAIELVCGLAPEDSPAPLSLTRRGTPRLGASHGARVATGDLAFDQAYLVDDARRLDGVDPLLADDLRPRLLTLLDGWLGVWPGEGTRYRSRNPVSFRGPDGLERILAMADLLTELKRR